MKILLLHSDYIEWEPKKKAIKSAEEVDKKKIRVDDVLVVLSAVEKNDEKSPQKTVDKATEDILSVMKQVQAKNVVVYPYAHLSPNLSNPDTAIKVLKGIEDRLKKKKITVKRAPFGWYKSFNVSCKGHPLAELSKQINIEGEEKQDISEAVKTEEKMKSNWYIMEPTGKIHKIEKKGDKISGFNFKGNTNLEKLAMYEIAKSRLVKQEPPHIPLMKKMGLAGYEPGSDPGNIRYPPKGRLVKSLLEDFVTRKTIDYGAMEVETPIMYDYEHPILKSYLNRFPARQYTVETPNKKTFLRFSACFGQFLMSKDASISYKNLPFRIYEMTRYSFRAEQRGELAGLRRLRAFTMPDCHSFVKDYEDAKKEMMNRFNLSVDIQKKIGFKVPHDFEFALRVVKDFYDKHKEFVKNFAKKWNKPILVEMWDKKFFYFVLKYEFNFVDALDKASALTTDQIDVENGERYGITYTDKDNTKKHPIILHLSPSGAIERVIYALLEKAYMEQKKGKIPVLPLWLAPTQVRLNPVSDAFNKYAEEVAEKMRKENIRVDVDDRVESVGKKIRDAETEWINLIVVIGEKEKKTKKLAVRSRETGKVRDLTVDALIIEIKKQIDGYPFKPLTLPKLLSRRAIFVA